MRRTVCCLPARRLLLLLAAGATLAGCEMSVTSSPGDREPLTGEVVRVVDGDTIHVRLPDGTRERVRYIGIDTPESMKPGAPVECFARAAAERNGELVRGERVRLQVDAEERDRYGRLLAYVYRERDALFVNAALLRDGYAKQLTIPPNVEHADAFRRLAAEARRAGRGLWSACA